MKAIVINSAGAQPEFREFPTPIPKYGEVLIKTGGCGICGTDQHILHEGLPTATYPIIPGHEPWGYIEEIGDGVEGFLVGDLVAVDPSLHCGQCIECRRARGNLCLKWGAIGGTNPGAWAEYFISPSKNLYNLSPLFPMECASLIEPVACAVRGVVRLDPKPNQSVLIFGGGTMGLLLGILLDIAGCSPITVVEKNENRIPIAHQRTGLDIRNSNQAAEISADLVIDATGVGGVIEQAITRVNPGGAFMIFGVASVDTQVSINPFTLYKNEIRITSSMAILHSFGPAIEVIEKHPDRFKEIITHNFSFSQLDKALLALSSGEAIKVSLHP